MFVEDERRLFEAISAPIVASDGHGVIAFLNRPAEELLGWTFAEVEGQRLSALMPERMRARHEAGIHRYLATHESRLLGKPVRVPARRKDGTELDIDLTLRLFRRPDGTDLIVGTLLPAGQERPPGLIELETKLQKRAYQLV